MSATPRTDAAEYTWMNAGCDDVPVVNVDISRALERELSAVTAERDALRAECVVLLNAVMKQSADDREIAIGTIVSQAPTGASLKQTRAYFDDESVDCALREEQK